MTYEWEVVEQSWFKRRTPTEIKPILSHYELIDFELKSDSFCKVVVVLDGERHTLNARVYCRETYEYQEDGSVLTHIHGWGVQGTNPHGISIILKLKQ